ncbi:ferric acinetobactin ABC transporter permease subunit BauC [Acinetobacter baumannii]|uniref:ferric acinetobactin ABC transporter permease subunit BauC n=1 Tax=Acinetobacter baumannii TaxID=470 RepID=UPI002295A2C1|nr:ferric acinetobactin ABC transporter permease subunit BauC [Acinetobacter baumannii]EKX4745300.1 ferric acinetobactin ABC transporter permease subunit BauC [Acinetobacter baumannii]ELA7823868.1 ferric acinetobactin ABC transporter permease subunit BauC [Acinetobacter baumannii]ELA7826035.1 ferric acinetobactin ABC transporter permease subunit BauC [Acinetobacter baumannii]MDC5497094.1 ferric acinetobactin ABC transporter permease subunit BauC [Acinetobacter baumannii]MDC5644975.1 ferric aci
MRITKLWMIYLIVICLAISFLFLNSGLDFDYVIPNRLLRLATIVIAGICVAFSSIVFQTLVGNRILTPSIMGYEAIYLLWQVLLLFFWGTHGLSQLGVNGNFFISIVLMLLYSWVIHKWLLPYGRNDVFLLLLLGLVLTMVVGTVTQFIQLKINPGEFSVFQGLSYASFNRSQPETLFYASVAVVIVLFLGRKALPVLDVLVLGREQAISLGIHHHRYVSFYLALIAILVAVSTSLIGPTVFMGVFIANITYALARSYKHTLTLPMGCAITIAIFIAAQILVEHVFNYKTTVSILVNLVCGIYFLALTVRTRGVA